MGEPGIGEGSSAGYRGALFAGPASRVEPVGVGWDGVMVGWSVVCALASDSEAAVKAWAGGMAWAPVTAWRKPNQPLGHTRLAGHTNHVPPSNTTSKRI
jgi:hypothetical protein